MKSPIIIIGMHRSGTTLVSRIFEQLGVFMGVKKDVNNESLFFQQFNEWLFAQAGVRWWNPATYRFFTPPQEAQRIFTGRFSGIHAISYWGIKNIFRSKKTITWGWKDPRNSITLPFWLSVFPQARIVHIYRNPIDVAKSLERRARKSSIPKKRSFLFCFKRFVKILLLRGIVFKEAERIQDPVEGIRLWKEYMERIESYNLPESTCLTIQYEALLATPAIELQKIMSFLHLPMLSETQVSEIAASLQKDRAFAHTREEQHALLSQCPDCEDIIKRYYRELFHG